MAIPTLIKRAASDIRHKIYGRDVRESMAKGIEVSGEIADESNERSKDTAGRQDHIETRYDVAVGAHTEDSEVMDARVDRQSNVHVNLKARLDHDIAILNDVTVSVIMLGVKADGETDDTANLQNALNSGYENFDFPNRKLLISEPITVPERVKKINFNNAHIIYTKEQRTSNPTHRESLFVIDNVDNLDVTGGKLQYTGTFDHGDSYGGKVSGLYVTNSDNLKVTGLEATGFSESGILLAHNDDYSYNCIIDKCNLHHNRVAGLRFGNIDGLIIRDSQMHFNGIQSDYSTGYGMAGISNRLPKNVKVIQNFCNDNYRKGIDFHAGQSLSVIDNTCLRNRVQGIYATLQNGTGTNINPSKTIQVKDNVVGEMFIDNTFDVGDLKGIAIGYTDGQDTNNTFNDNWEVSGNSIIEFTNLGSRSVKFAYPIYVLSGGGNNATYSFRDNTLKVGKVESLIAFYGMSNGAPGDNNRATINSNKMTANEVHQLPYYLRGDSNITELTIKDDNLNVDKLTVTTHLVHVSAGVQFDYLNNSITTKTIIPDYFEPSGVTNNRPEVKALNNIVNGKMAPSWNGRKSTWENSRLPDGGYWRAGSVIYTDTSTEFMGWRKVTAESTNRLHEDWVVFGYF